MTNQDFQNQIQKLINVYGEKAYPKERSEQLWWWAKKIEAPLFADIVAKLIAECDRAPLLAKFKEAFIDVRNHHTLQKMECCYCNGEGFYMPPDSPPLGPAYACRCPAGELIPRYVARWRGIMIKQVPTEAELNWHNRAIEAVAKFSEDHKMPEPDHAMKAANDRTFEEGDSPT